MPNPTKRFERAAGVGAEHRTAIQSTKVNTRVNKEGETVEMSTMHTMSTAPNCWRPRFEYVEMPHGACSTLNLPPTDALEDVMSSSPVDVTMGNALISTINAELIAQYPTVGNASDAQRRIYLLIGELRRRVDRQADNTFTLVTT